MDKRLTICVYGNAIIIISLAVYLFIIPAGILFIDLRDPGLYTGDVPKFTFRWHRALSGDFESWARDRVALDDATKLDTYDISGTEWPMFSSVFYLWATETLQEAWDANPTLAKIMPVEYAQGAIESAGALIADPNHATWVKNHWGDDYLQRENLFYRMLLISGLTSYQKLLGDNRFQDLLYEQVDSLAKEIDGSPYGLLDDYPGECYSIDIMPAIAAIQRADVVLGTDHSVFVARALRAFEGSRLDQHTGLPAYIADSKTGEGHGSARGVGVSFMLTWVPELWPETAKNWYSKYEMHFWQEGWLVVGFREFPKGQTDRDWFFFDVDAGPIIAGYGTAASAFGVGATRTNRRFDHAYPLSAEALVVSWPLMDGTLLGPRLLSNLSDAPYIGEAALLYSMTRQPLLENGVTGMSPLPFSVYAAQFMYFIIGIILVGWKVVGVRRWKRYSLNVYLNRPNQRFSIWLTLFLGGLIAMVLRIPTLGMLFLIIAQYIPRRREFG